MTIQQNIIESCFKLWLEIKFTFILLGLYLVFQYLLRKGNTKFEFCKFIFK